MYCVLQEVEQNDSTNRKGAGPATTRPKAESQH